MKPTQREGEYACRCRIEPLLVIDRDQNRACGGKRSQHPEHCSRQGLHVAGAVREVAGKQSGPHRVGLRIRQRLEDAVGDPIEQIVQPREREH